MHQMLISGQLSDPTGLWGTFLVLLIKRCPNDWFVSNTACVTGLLVFTCVNTVLTKKKCSNFSREGCTSKKNVTGLFCAPIARKYSKKIAALPSWNRDTCCWFPSSQPVRPRKGKFKREDDRWQVEMCYHQGVTSTSVISQPVQQQQQKNADLSDAY